VDIIQQMKVGPTDGEAQPDMGAVITAAHRDRVNELISLGEAKGGKVLADGRGTSVEEAPGGFYVRPTIIDEVDYSNDIATTEIFGPVLSVMRAKTLDEAIAAANRQSYGNGACVFTTSGKAAREFRTRVSAGMVGVNVGVPAPMAYFPFTGWNQSFFGDLHMQGKEGVQFYTKQKTTTTRWFSFGEGDIWVKS
jgi:malonate-semialdehyde dehydrogenase (acetylating)/methylmalonate-semialdehyde dehydrogenase